MTKQEAKITGDSASACAKARRDHSRLDAGYPIVSGSLECVENCFLLMSVTVSGVNFRHAL